MRRQQQHDSDVGEQTAASGINLITTIVVILALAALLWFLFTGPLAGIFAGGGATNIQVKLQQQAPPAQPPSRQKQDPGGRLPGELQWAAQAQPEQR